MIFLTALKLLQFVSSIESGVTFSIVVLTMSVDFFILADHTMTYDFQSREEPVKSLTNYIHLQARRIIPSNCDFYM